MTLKLKTLLPSLCLSLAGAAALAATHPKIDGNPTAPTGGTFYRNFPAEPESLNPINASDLYSQRVQELVMDTLLRVDPNTYQPVPSMAESYEVSKDGLTYTFKLREGLTFSDGKPVTSEDVKFSFECAKDPAYKAAQKLPYIEDLEKIETPDARTIVFKMKKKYFKTLEVLGEGYFMIVPKHVYGDPKKMGSKKMIGSGPYMIAEYNRGKNILLKRNPNWWGYKDPQYAGIFKFDQVYFRFIKEENLELEMVKKGQIDFMGTTPEIFVKKAVGAPFGKTILKHQVENQDPTTKGYNYVGWNLENDLFKDKRVRQALSALMNRKLMNEKFRFNMSDMATGPTYYRNEAIVNRAIKPIEFDIKKADQLLKDAGWADTDKDGILDKKINGQKKDFSFTLLLPSRDVEKYFTLYREDLKKAGINMDIKIIEWNSFLKLMDEHKFEAVTLSWGVGSLEQDLKQIWHSASAQPGGSNFISYKNPEVDKLIDSARQELDTKKRLALWRKAYAIIAEDCPYTFMFSNRYDLYLVNKRIGMTEPTLKYSLGTDYWWDKTAKGPATLRQ
jgi:peptide/nickel transport system substrate-binding protein/microcin C transport system substrate-binding protein